MLNICIPVYNYDVNKLVAQLYEQCVKSGVDFKIFVCEDHSADEYLKKNAKITNLKNVFHIVNEKNLGRSKTRNLLAKQADQGNIIFLDCDSLLPNDEFISNYLKYSNQNVVYGGTIYLPGQLKPNSELRYYYGVKREMIKSEQRAINANRCFTTNNFMISKSVFDTVKFNESLTEYGHEDTLFGIDLYNNSIPISHIDNPVIHVGIEDNEVFLTKTETALENLKIIYKSIDNQKSFSDSVRILDTYTKLEKYRLKWIVSLSFKFIQKPIRNYLVKSKHPNLILLDIYKLGFFCLINDRL